MEASIFDSACSHYSSSVESDAGHDGSWWAAPWFEPRPNSPLSNGSFTRGSVDRARSYRMAYSHDHEPSCYSDRQYDQGTISGRWPANGPSYAGSVRASRSEARSSSSYKRTREFDAPAEKAPMISFQQIKISLRTAFGAAFSNTADERLRESIISLNEATTSRETSAINLGDIIDSLAQDRKR